MKSLLPVFFLFFSSLAFSQNIKTDVLVVGANAAGVAAAIQAARSGVKTVLVAESGALGQDITSSSPSFKSGIYAEFLKNVRTLKKDTNALTDPATTAQILKAMTDTVKNLTVRYNSGWQEIKKSGKGWEVKLKEAKSSVKANVVVDATLNELLASSAGVFIDAKTKLHKTLVPAATVASPYNGTGYRTSAGVGLDAKTSAPYILPLGAIFASAADNFFIVGKLAASQLSPDAMYTGQAAGATASFFAFFDESTKHMSLTMRTRQIQSELLTHKSWLMPFTDIAASDPDFIILQHIGLTGILKADISTGNFKFNPDSSVSSAEVRAPFKEYYSRSQIWFADHPAIAKFTVADLISLLKYAGSRGNELDKEIEKGWKDSFYFTGKYDPLRVLTRREYAVLVEHYLQPFAVRVNLTGTLGN